MGYAKKKGRPLEYASKSSHTQIINDPAVQSFLENGRVPKKADEIDLPAEGAYEFKPTTSNPIKNIIAIDGGYEEVFVQSEFPSSTICFFQFGALTFSIADLESINHQEFIEPKDMAKLKQIQRFKFTLPVKNFGYKDEPTLTHGVRRAVYDFFNQSADEEDKLIDTLKWFIFQEYNKPLAIWNLASCPHCKEVNIPLVRTSISSENTFKCKHCAKEIFLTDVFRLHEAIDDELGAGGILGYVTTTFEQILLLHVIRKILGIKPVLLKSILFIKDGPLAFFGQTANMFKPMRSLVKFLFENHDLNLAGLEKSGPFVEHADQIAEKLPPSSILLLSNDYIYKYIIPGKADSSNPYGRTTYYSNKLIYKSQSSGMYVVSLPTEEVLFHPTAKDYHNLQVILTNLDKLKCDMYDNALMPVALVNKLVSLAQFPSTKILQRFVADVMP
ncbi:MAG: hypothetical protein P4L50_04380 [Anaerolineaceae bacterium]|nr:hypothetical protein [Anaerolineaceae bacterium]